MPGHTHTSALIAAYCFDGTPWNWPTWQDLTGVHHGLFPADDAKLPYGWTRQNASDVKAFFNAYHRIPVHQDDLRIAFANERKGSPQYPGRDFWREWVKRRWAHWGIHSIILKELKETGIHPQAILLREGTESFAWPNANDYIPIVIDSLGIQLFGEDAFHLGYDILPSQYRSVIKSFVLTSWTRIRSQIKYMQGRANQIEAIAKASFKGRS